MIAFFLMLFGCAGVMGLTGNGETAFEPQERVPYLIITVVLFAAAAALVIRCGIEYLNTPTPTPLVDAPVVEAGPLGLLSEWQTLLDLVPGGQDELSWLSRTSGTSFRALDFVRRTRNRVAHGDGSVSAEEIDRALDVVARTRQALYQP